MKIPSIICISFILILKVTATEHNPDPEEERLLIEVKKAPKIGLPLLLEYNLKKLKAVYAKVLEESEPEMREALTKSQKTWEQFYKADSVVASWNAKGGSSAVPAKLEQMIYQVKLRIYLLSTPQMQGWISIPTIPNPIKSANK